MKKYTGYVEKACQVFEENPYCEGTFRVHVRAAKSKVYCDKCTIKKKGKWHKEYNSRRRAEARAVKVKEAIEASTKE